VTTLVSRGRRSKYRWSVLVAATWAAGLASCATSTSSARSAVDASLGCTEAAGSAYFVRVNTVPGGATSTMEGSVNFARSELSMVTYSGAPSSAAAVEDVRQVGSDLYDKFLLPTRKDVAERGGVLGYLGLSRWYVQRARRPVAAQVLPLGAFSGARKVSLVGRASLSGVETREYEVAMPAQSSSGTKLEPFTVDVWLDHKDRVRRTLFTEVETIKGSSGKLRFSTLTTLSDFGAPVHVAAPPHPEVLRP
jgi:hypothetical protein